MSKPTYEETIKRAKTNADCGEYLSPAEVTELLFAFEAQVKQLAAENAALKESLAAVIDRSNEPEYQTIGMGCGVEDNGLQTDGYNACEYGWREAMGRIYSEVIPEEIPETPVTDAYAASLRAEGVEMLKQKLEQETTKCYQDEQIGLDSAVTLATEFAAQLRSQSEQVKGVQS